MSFIPILTLQRITCHNTHELDRVVSALYSEPEYLFAVNYVEYLYDMVGSRVGIVVKVNIVRRGDVFEGRRNLLSLVPNNVVSYQLNEVTVRRFPLRIELAVGVTGERNWPHSKSRRKLTYTQWLQLLEDARVGRVRLTSVSLVNRPIENENAYPTWLGCMSLSDFLLQFCQNVPLGVPGVP